MIGSSGGPLKSKEDEVFDALVCCKFGVAVVDIASSPEAISASASLSVRKSEYEFGRQVLMLMLVRKQ